MLYIEKEPCPADIQEKIDSLTGRRKWQQYSDPPAHNEPKEIRKEFFDKMDKSRVREALIAEQHGLCAYCMCSIKNDGRSTTIEHFVPLSKSKAGAMSYQNWLAVCKGGADVKIRGNERRIICCDAKKSNTVTTLTPLDRRQMDNIAYYEDGTIYYSDDTDPQYQDFTKDIDQVYGLNGKLDPNTHRSQKDTASGIVKQRKDAYISLFDELMRMQDEGVLTLEFLHALREDYLKDAKWEAFLGVKLYVLDMFLKTIG